MSLTIYILGAFAIGVFAGVGWGYHAGYRSVIAPRKKSSSPKNPDDYLVLGRLPDPRPVHGLDRVPPVREKKS